MLKSKITILEENINLFTSAKYLIKNILNRSRYNFKKSSKLNIDLD